MFGDVISLGYPLSPVNDKVHVMKLSAERNDSPNKSNNAFDEETGLSLTK